jgi:predicted ester cyclase
LFREQLLPGAQVRGGVRALVGTLAVGVVKMRLMSNRQSFLKAVRCFADPNTRQGYFELYSPDIVLHGYRGVEPGLESAKRFYTSFWLVFSDARIEIEDLIEQDDNVAARYSIKGTQRREFMGIAPSGRSINLPGISLLHFRNGQCFERWTCSDSLLLLNQLQG